MKVLITGSKGQLGYELQRTVPQGYELLCVDVDQLDVTSSSAVNDYFSACQPDAVINAAAYTAVDKAETDKELAYAVNATGPELLAKACAEADIPMIQVSTDFVFDGNASMPYRVDDRAAPVSVYGDSKLKGEEAVTAILGNRAAIIRTAWVYSAHGNNFVKTMLRLMRQKEQLGVVADQIGTPTWAKTLAECCWKTLQQLRASSFQLPTILHWTDAGVASWYDFAVAVQEEAVNLGLLEKAIPVRPIPASAYPTPARRPAFGVLNKQISYENLEMPIQHWRDCLREMLQDLKHSSEE